MYENAIMVPTTLKAKLKSKLTEIKCSSSFFFFNVSEVNTCQGYLLFTQFTYSKKYSFYIFLRL